MKITRDYKPYPRNIRNVPYNTGKVKVGLAYEPPRKSHITPDGERMQRVLIGAERREFRQNVGWAIYLALMLIASIGALALIG